MARGKLFTDIDREMINAGRRLGFGSTIIGRAIGRTKQGVDQQIKAMRDKGTLDQETLLPWISENEFKKKLEK